VQAFAGNCPGTIKMFCLRRTDYANEPPAMSETEAGKRRSGADTVPLRDDFARQELNFWRPTPSPCSLWVFGLTPTSPPLKELEEWFETEKEISAIAKLDRTMHSFSHPGKPHTSF
jgi:hypothetical protein